MKKLFFIILSTAVFCLLVSSCSLFQPKEDPIDYKVLEQTASIRLTQTFEALPTSTATFTPLPTNTPLPTDTPTPAPTDTDTPVPLPEEDDMLLIRKDPSGDEDADMFIVRKEDAEMQVTPEPTATVYFPDKADFVAALPSPNQFVPNQHFYLTWQIRNTGTSTWSGKYRFYHSDGIALADQDSYGISEIVEPGGVLTITMPATSPSAEGTYSTTWTLENPDGIPFYYLNFAAIVGDRTFITAVPELNPTNTPSSLEWMCSSPERSMIQGDGCVDFCSAPVVQQMESEGNNCYANGERIE